MNTIDKRLAALGITIPSVNPPHGNYLSYVRAGSLIFVAGQGPRKDGQLVYRGVVGGDLTLEDGENAARICAVNVLSQLLHACDGDLSNIRQMVRIAGLVRCTESFEDQTRVLNAASNLICDILGNAGKHARIASGVQALPSGMAVEIEAVAEIS
ncbi:RidA family protein [Mesorhizobium sp. M0590]|uniref:RidA family protein n=1 Tax=Mesorhizobium sp. M0590 TaxID=2956966 RepID=UPI00333AF415